MDNKRLEKFEELNQDVDIDNRVIYLESEIDITVPSFIQQRVNLISYFSKNKVDPITIELTSYGGDAFGAFAVIDTIRSLKMPIHILARGAVMSSGALVLVAATGLRTITENTYVMLHSASSALAGNTDDILIEAANLKNVTEKTFILLEKYSNKNQAYWQQKCKKNFYLTPEQCLEHGLVDKVLYTDEKESKKN